MGYYVEDHYNELVAEFAEPASRTRQRLRPVYAHMLKALTEVETRGNDFFKKLAEPFDPLGLLPEQIDEFSAIESAWRQDLAGVQDRSLKIYGPELVPLGVDPFDLDEWCSKELGRCEDPAELQPRSWEGLIVGRSITNPDGLKAGPVPDAAMPAYLAAQLEVVSQHMIDYWNPWWLRLMKSIPKFIKRAGEAVADAVESATGALEQGSTFMRVLPWALGGAVGVALLLRARKK